MWDVEFTQLYEDRNNYVVFQIDDFSQSILSAAFEILNRADSIDKGALREIEEADSEMIELEFGLDPELFSPDVIDALSDRFFNYGYQKIENFIIGMLQDYLGYLNDGEFELVDKGAYGLPDDLKVRDYPVLARYNDDGEVSHIYELWTNYGFAQSFEMYGEVKFKLIRTLWE